MRIPLVFSFGFHIAVFLFAMYGLPSSSKTSEIACSAMAGVAASVAPLLVGPAPACPMPAAGMRMRSLSQVIGWAWRRPSTTHWPPRWEAMSESG